MKLVLVTWVYPAVGQVFGHRMWQHSILALRNNDCIAGTDTFKIQILLPFRLEIEMQKEYFHYVCTLRYVYPIGVVVYLNLHVHV